MQRHFPGLTLPWLFEKVRTRIATIAFSTMIALVTLAASLLPAQPVSAQGTVPALPPEPSEPAAPDWLEPRGLSVVDMVGNVPEDALRDAILVYLEGTGLVQYASGSRTGNTVVIDTYITPRFGPGFTKVGCLGQPAVYDQIPVVVPAGTMQIFENGQDITLQINYQSTYIPAGLTQPSAGSTAYLRYGRVPLPTNGASPARIPANASCEILIDGVHKGKLTARFTFNAAPQVKVTFKGDQTFYAHSYIGEGNAGALNPLSEAMWRTFGERHDSFLLNIPADADYMFVKYAPTPFDPYAADQYSYNLPGSGTYRFELSSSEPLSVDHVNSMGIPTWGSWRDADKSDVDASFLEAISLRGRIKTPEYFLPPGIAFDQCMVSGGCPRKLLDDIYAQTFPVHVYYYNVERLAGTALTRVPLKQVGPSWSAPTSLGATGDGAAAFVMPDQPPPAAYLPIVGKNKPPVQQPLPPGDPTGCPCGWFTAAGQMVAP